MILKSSKSIISQELKQVLLLAIPLMLSEVVDASFGFTSAMLASRLGIMELAAGGLVTTLFITIMVFIWGILISVSTLVSQYLGAEDHDSIARVTKDALIIATILSIPSMLLTWNMAPILLFFGQKADTVALAEQYLHSLTWAIPPDFWAVVLLQLAIGLGKPRIVLLFNIVRVPLTLGLGYILMFGKLSLPKIGLAGLGWGVSIGMWLTTSLLIVYVLFNKELRYYLQSSIAGSRHYFFEILKMGLPVAGMFCLEVGYLTVMALMIGKISSEALAANQIAQQYEGFFIVVVSFSVAHAVSMRVGNALGKRDLSGVGSMTYAACIITATMMMGVSCSYWFIPHHLIALDIDPSYVGNKTTVQEAVKFLAVAGFVQLFEAIRIVLFGVLRGLGETKVSMITSLIMFWVIAFPVGLFLTFTLKWGGVGMWLGMALGAFCGAWILYWWLLRVLPRFQSHAP